MELLAEKDKWLNEEFQLNWQWVKTAKSFLRNYPARVGQMPNS